MNKRELLAHWLDRTGVSALAARAPHRDLLLVLNYHRVGDANATPWDPGVFSASAEQFDEQVGWVKRHLQPVGLDEGVEFVSANGRARPGGTRVLFTFDDGYLDNFEIAFPILRSHGLQGVFFLASALVGSDQIPWWDVIAFVVKQARRRAFTLRYPAERTIDVDKQGLTEALRQVLLLYKEPEMTDSDRFLAELQESCGGPHPGASGERLFLDWDQAGQMVAGGMAIGAHTHTHRILGRLEADEQRFELSEGRRILRQRLGIAADTLAYPVGTRSSFTPATQRLAQECGYRACFSFYGGLNFPGRTDHYNILRSGVDGQSMARFRTQAAHTAALARFWP